MEACKRKTLARNARLGTALLFLLAAVLGLFLVGPRGIGVDEATERRILDVNIKAYIQQLGGEDSELYRSLGEIPDIDTFLERDHGQAQSYPVWPLMHWMQSRGDLRGMEWVYHYGLYALFLLAAFGLYSILYRLTGSRGAGLVTAGLLFVNPRFFAESFYNNKDMALFSLCVIVLWLGLRFVQERSWSSCIWFGVAGAFAANTRVIGLAAFGLMGLVYLAWLTLNRQWSARAFGRGVLAVGTWLAVFYLITPACWHDFFGFWGYYLGASSNFSAARWNGWFLYRGAVYNPVENPIPWHYIPWLMAITTPLLVLALAALWPVLRVRRCGRSRQAWQTPECLFELGLCVFFAAPLLYAMLARPNLYNGWRHFYFIYGPVVILAGQSAFWLWQNRRVWLRRALAGVLAAHFVFFAGYIAANFPNEHVYFNGLAGPHPEQNYDADYWNIGQRTVMERLQELDPEFRVAPRQQSALLAWNWYRLRDAMDPPPDPSCEEVSWERRARAPYVAENTSAWRTDQLHPAWDEADPEVQAWQQAMQGREPIFQVKCGRTVLWNVYENPEYAG